MRMNDPIKRNGKLYYREMCVHADSGRDARKFFDKQVNFRIRGDKGVIKEHSPGYYCIYIRRR